MSAYYHYNQPTATAASHSHHGGRNRRAPRLSVSQNSQKQFRGVRSMKELTESASLSAFRMRFEAGRSFDLEDDMEFCPGLLTDDDLVSINSASSERSSLASNSPESSPTQQPNTVAPAFSLNSTSPAFIPPAYQTQHSLKLHQPSATRARNAIPIVNPLTGISMSSPPPSVSPARMQQTLGRRCFFILAGTDTVAGIDFPFPTFGRPGSTIPKVDWILDIPNNQFISNPNLCTNILNRHKHLV